MKLVSAATLFATSVMADKWAQLGDLWQSAQQNDNIDEADRKVMELFTISSVANYGCWCRFNTYKPYKGPAQDTMDMACEQWHKNYDCLHHDFTTDSPYLKCGEDTQYVDVVTQVQDPFDVNTDYAAECAKPAPDGNAELGDCAINACYVDAVFIRHIVNYLAENTLNMTLSGWYGFDGSACRGATALTQTVSPIMGTTGAPGVVTTDPAATTQTPVDPIACCGAYPERFPYRHKNGERACCVDKTYNTNLLECCPDNSVDFIGDC
jgi:hypothetical protein